MSSMVWEMQRGYSAEQQWGMLPNTPFLMAHYPVIEKEGVLPFFGTQLQNGMYPVIDEALKQSLDRDRSIDLSLWNGFAFHTIDQIPTNPAAANFQATMLKLANIYQRYLF